ncbi:MAG TPA: type II toxin-antitoxin system RelE/ParE family toxin [Candidatus Mediterraneibacter merdipullorum]|nr:type II toxin-antitoxin system RelE/ParE family toxin [Candidatus Mediterraneibacter merdipullorum]
MGKRIVEITQTALEDMEGIYDYIADVLLAAENAMGQYNRIADAILTLESNPERCPVFEVEPEHSWGMRRMVIDNYLVCYIVDMDKVTVTDVLYGASNVHARLRTRHMAAPDT